MRGYSNVMYVGGFYDGKTDNLPNNILRDKIRIMPEYYYSAAKNGKGMDIRRFNGKLDENWQCFIVFIYQKKPKKNNSTGVVYEFIEELEIDRCSALTKKGKQCLNESERNSEFCKQHIK